ncbi:MAG: hypothetical protein NYU05_01495 [Aigarchaeota archaeon]|nr:hypothetical protein [Candidatus Caldarchaeales archaeon]
MQFYEILYDGGHAAHPTPFEGFLIIGDENITLSSRDHSIRITFSYNQIESIKEEISYYTSIWRILGWTFIGAIAFLITMGYIGMWIGMLIGAIIGYAHKEKKQALQIIVAENKLKQNVKISSQYLPQIQKELYYRMRT